MNEETTPSFEILPPSALESIERANIDVAIATAHRYPRSLAVVNKRMLNLATLDEETAASCFYKLNRQGKNIEGPSIRLAEIAASSYGNIRFGARVVSDDGKQVTAQGFCHDLETNVLSTIEVKRRVTNKEGQRYSEDMVVVTGNAACSIAARNAIFKVVPFAFLKPVFLKAKEAAVGTIATLADRRTKMLSIFASFGVNEKRVCASVGKAGIEEIGLEELGTLIGVHTAIRDGDTSVDEAFPELKAPIKFGAATPEGTAAGVVATPAAEPTKKRGRPKKHTGPGVEPGSDEPGPTGPTGLASVANGGLGGATGAVGEKPFAPPLATPLEGLRNLMKTSGIEEKDLLTYLFSKQQCNQGDTLASMPEAKIVDIRDAWTVIVPDMKKPETGEPFE